MPDIVRGDDDVPGGGPKKGLVRWPWGCEKGVAVRLRCYTKFTARYVQDEGEVGMQRRQWWSCSLCEGARVLFVVVVAESVLSVPATRPPRHTLDHGGPRR